MSELIVAAYPVIRIDTAHRKGQDQLHARAKPGTVLQMAYTQDDFDAVETAIRQVRDGQRANSQSAGEASQAFVNTSIPDLIKLRESIALELSTTTPVGEVRTRGRSRIFRTNFSRGL